MKKCCKLPSYNHNNHATKQIYHALFQQKKTKSLKAKRSNEWKLHSPTSSIISEPSFNASGSMLAIWPWSILPLSISASRSAFEAACSSCSSVSNGVSSRPVSSSSSFLSTVFSASTLFGASTASSDVCDGAPFNRLRFFFLLFALSFFVCRLFLSIESWLFEMINVRLKYCDFIQLCHHLY